MVVKDRSGRTCPHTPPVDSSEVPACARVCIVDGSFNYDRITQACSSFCLNTSLFNCPSSTAPIRLISTAPPAGTSAPAPDPSKAPPTLSTATPLRLRGESRRQTGQCHPSFPSPPPALVRAICHRDWRSDCHCRRSLYLGPRRLEQDLGSLALIIAISVTYCPRLHPIRRAS